MERAGSLLRPVFKRLGITDGVSLARIKNDWSSIFDKPLSLHMSPSKLFEGELLLNVDSPVWIHQLGFYKKEITEKLRYYGVKDVRFRIGRVAQGKKQQAVREDNTELSHDETLFISGAVSSISDEMIKAAAKRAIEKSFRAKKPTKK